MAVKIGELLVEHGMVTQAQVEEALRAQTIFGGRLGSNLVELGYLTEQSLATFLAIQLDLPSVELGEVDSIPPEVIEMIPGELAAKHRVLPVRMDKRKLRLAMADPSDMKAMDEISFLTGWSLQPVVAPELLILYSLERYYGIKRPTRYLRVTGAPDVEFQVVQTQQLGGQMGGDSGVVIEDRAAFLQEGRADFAAPKYTLQNTLNDLADIKEQKDVFDILRRYTSQLFRQVAFFVVRGISVQGWLHHGGTITDDDFVKLQFAIADSPHFTASLKAKSAFAGPIPANRIDDWIVKSFGFTQRKHVLTVPVLVNGQLVAVMMASGELHGQMDAWISPMDDLAKRVSCALQMVFLRKRVLHGA